MSYNFSDTGLDLNLESIDDATFNATMKSVEIKYWDYLDNYDRSSNPFLSQYNFLYRLVQSNNLCYDYDSILKFWKRYEKHKRTIPTSGLIIIAPGRSQILLVKVYNSDIFGMPKGKHEQDESSIAAALREVQEETGLTFHINDLANATNPILINRTFFYLVYLYRDIFTFDNYNKNEIIDIQWIGIKDILNNPKNYSKQVLAVAQYILNTEGSEGLKEGLPRSEGLKEVRP
jgi:8-oxo-dGTP pyrophosphatase MutT (NUDIX family)